MSLTPRIKTTHTGSLARPSSLRDLLVARAKGQPIDEDLFTSECREAVRVAVRRQCEIGLDIINDGEQSKTGFAQYVHERLSGFEGEPVRRVVSLETRQFPNAPTGSIWQIPCRGQLNWKNFAAVQRDINILKEATKDLDRTVFMASISPGSFANNNPNQYYKDRSAYLLAIADIMQKEYEAIAEAGFVVQLDCPDLAQRSYNFPDMRLSDWLGIVAENIEALNHATRSIPRERLRVHVCWGANEGPHNYDTELKDIIDLLFRLRVSAVSMVGANGRHEHEWRVWQTVEVPENMKVVTGVIDSTTNIIEHPRVVADRLLRMCRILGQQRVIAGVDCGFGVSGSVSPKVDPDVAWAKLEVLVEGARLAGEEL